jgi:hypothetical protein
MLVYSYIFSNVYKGYSKFGSSTPYVYSVGVVTLLQLFTVFDIIALLNLFGSNVPSISTVRVFILAAITILINHLYYYVYQTPEKIEKQLNSLAGSKIRLLKTLTWIHVVVTVGLFFILINLR